MCSIVLRLGVNKERSMKNRREFLLKVAMGVAYSASVIRTLASPPELLAQGESTTSTKGGMGMLVVQQPVPTEKVLPGTPQTSTAPWAKKPGGR